MRNSDNDLKFLRNNKNEDRNSYNKTVTSFVHYDIQLQRFLQTTERLQKLENMKLRSLCIRILLIISLGLGERH
jgi:hypothetical protein